MYLQLENLAKRIMSGLVYHLKHDKARLVEGTMVRWCTTALSLCVCRYDVDVKIAQ